MNEKQALLVLNAIPGLSNRQLRKLMEYFGSAKNILSASLSGLKSAKTEFVKKAESIIHFPKEDFLKKETVMIQEHNVKVTTYREDDYPKVLKEIPDAPVVLYYKGDINALNSPAIAMVGSRKASLYGLTTAETFSIRLAERGVTIISGMARGIDTASHKGALMAKGKTIAVLGSGLAQIYPKSNLKLAEEITQSGAVVSEFPMDMQPFAFNFPRRNRIISGLSLGVVVVEAAKKSGALITAEFALEQGREVFAIPGKVDSPTSSGVHHLIKQGAKLVSSVDDIFEEFEQHFSLTVESKQPKLDLKNRLKNVSPEEKEIYNHIQMRPVHIDQLASQCQKPIPHIMAGLMKLELKGLIRQMPGKLFTVKV